MTSAPGEPRGAAARVASQVRGAGSTILAWVGEAKIGLRSALASSVGGQAGARVVVAEVGAGAAVLAGVAPAIHVGGALLSAVPWGAVALV